MLTFGSRLKQKEHISARLGDVLSQLYICSAMLKRYEAIGRPAADQAILAWAFHDSIYKIQFALQLVVDNFPSRVMRVLLQGIIFPFGRRERMPGDRLTHKVAQLLLAPSDTRDRLTHGIYKSARARHPVGLMDQALPQVIAAEPLERKLLKALKTGDIEGITWEQQLEAAVAQGILNPQEAEIMVRVRALVMEIIAVDEFDSDEIRLGQRLESKLGQQHAA
jgi:acyl-CoA dehydrogenase